MAYPRLTELSTSREMVDVFRGYNHNLRIRSGEFYDMENMSSDNYPVLAPRGKRGIYASPVNALGMIEKDALCYIDGSEFVMNEYRVDLGLSVDASDLPKQLVSMGAYVVIFPDGKYINTLDLTDFGSINAGFTTTADVTFSLCNLDGESYSNVTTSASEPSDPDNLAYWIDTSSTPHTLKQWSATSAMWVTVPTTYVKISSANIGKAFQKFDGVTVSGVLDEKLQALNATSVVWARGDDYIVVVGILDAVSTQLAADGAVTVERKAPRMDYVTEAGNRLWGCRYGVAENGDVVNEIYACKLGDFKNWKCHMGLSTDSYAASVGTDGQFTGSITHLGYPIFFKENAMHKVYPSGSGAHSIQDTACKGVQRGCWKSLKIVGDVLYYKARSGICAYDGSLPQEISSALGETAYSDAVAGSIGNKYYVSMRRTDGTWHLFVYDAAKGLWHREDNLRADAFCAFDGELYCIDHGTGKIITLLGSGTELETAVPWMAETGDLGISSPDMKYVSRMTVRMSMAAGSSMRFYIRYDLSDTWEEVCSVEATSLRSYSIPIRPRRCDHFRMRIEGTGAAHIYSITKTIEQGSELS